MRVIKIQMRLARLSNGLTMDRDVIGAINIGLRYLSSDGSPMPLGSTATSEPIEIPRSLWGRWKSPDAKGLKTLWIKKQNNPKQTNINDNQ